MHSPVPPASTCETAPATTPARLTLLWLVFVALAFCVNSSSYGAKAAAGPGFISQLEHLVFAGNNDKGRFIRAADLQLDDDQASPVADWLAIPAHVASLRLPTPLFISLVAAPQATPHCTHVYQQGPRAPPVA